MHEQGIIALQNQMVGTSDHNKYYPVSPDSLSKLNHSPIMVAAQASAMPRHSSPPPKSQPLEGISGSTTALQALEPKCSSDVPYNAVEKPTDHQAVEASRIDEEEIAKTLSARPADDDHTMRETGDLFGDAIARGKMLQQSGRYREALENYRVALQCKNKTFASEPKVVQAIFGDVLFDIGTIHWEFRHGDPEQSLEAFHFCLQVRRACFGSNHPAVARTLCQVASLHASADDHECALQMFLEALYIFLAVTPEDRAALFNVWMAIGNAKQALGLVEEAQSAFQEAEQVKK